MNMREIKFRAWDVINKKMYPVVFSIWNWIIECKIDFTNHTIEKIESDWDDRPIVMQYTWLKDKNWKEVYEWDIIKVFTFEWKYVETDKVIFEDWRFTIPWWWTHNLYWCEIIWNIYENPL